MKCFDKMIELEFMEIRKKIKSVLNEKSAPIRLWQRSSPAGRQTVREGLSQLISTVVSHHF